MRVSDSRQMLFIHVQKTGGSSIDVMIDREISDALSVKGVIRHATLGMVLKSEPGLASYWTFGFVRTPWARMASWWAMSRDVLDRAAAGDPDAIKRIKANPVYWDPVSTYGDFGEFVEQGSQVLPRLRRPQIDFLQTTTRRADFIGRQETFALDVAAVRARLGFRRRGKVPRDNVTPHAHYREFYSDATRDRVGELFAADVKVFGYEF